MKPQGNGERSYLKTSKKGNVTINPKKEDLMSESLRKHIQSAVGDLREAAKKKSKEKHIAAAKAGKRWQDSDGDGKGMSLAMMSRRKRLQHLLSLLTTPMLRKQQRSV